MRISPDCLQPVEDAFGGGRSGAGGRGEEQDVAKALAHWAVPRGSVRPHPS